MGKAKQSSKQIVEEEEEENVSIVETKEDTSPAVTAYQNLLDSCLAGGGESMVASSITFLDKKVKSQPCFLGIDEAGRGPVLGPMLYACAVAPITKNTILKEMGLADSKQLTESKREELLEAMLKKSEWIAYNIHIISPMEITGKMLSYEKISLNKISQDSAIGLIRSALAQGVNLKEVYVDTVGKAETYQNYLQSLFPKLSITVESKADATYPIVSAASIYAKVTRDRLLSRWPIECRGPVPANTPIGSGYPGDPITKQYLRMCMDPIFGFPPVVRTSWSTAQNLLEENGVKVTWEDDIDAEDLKKRLARKRPSETGSTKISGFFKATPNKPDHIKRQPFFVKTGLVVVESF